MENDEKKLAIKYFKQYGMESYEFDGNVYLIVKAKKRENHLYDCHVQLSNKDVRFRAELMKSEMEKMERTKENNLVHDIAFGNI